MTGTARTTKAFHVNGIHLDQAEDYVYIGQRFTLTEKHHDNEIKSRIKAGSQAFGLAQHNYEWYTTSASFHQ